MSAEREALVAEMRELTEEQLGRLHPVERMIITDVLEEPRRMSCEKCLLWMGKLIEKAKGQTVG